MRKIKKIWIGIIIAVIVYTFFTSKICGSRYHPTPQIPRDFFSYKIFKMFKHILITGDSYE